MRIFATVAFFLLLTGPSFAQTKVACDIAYEEYPELRKPVVEKADKAYNEFMSHYDSKRDKTGNIKNPVEALKFGS